MATSTTRTNKPINPRGNDQSPLKYNRAALYSGKALDFDGVNDYVSVSYTEGIGGVWSWVSIIEFDSVSGYQELFGGQYGSTNATIYLKNTQLDFYTSGDNVNTAFDFETGKKYHIACSQSGDTISVYVNGQAAGSVSLTAQLNRSNGVYVIGKHPVNSNEYLNGKISGTKLFNTALTAAQVSDLYNNPEKIVPTGVDNTALKLWLPMMEGAGTTAYDGSGNGNHGTISGATYVNGVGAPVAQSAVMDWNKGENLLQYSEALNTSNYFSGIRILFESNQSAPNGTTDAMRLKLSTTATNTSAYIIRGGVSGYAGQTISAFFKADEITEVLLFSNGGAGIYFDIENGAFVSYFQNSANIDSYNIEDFGGGWRRYSITFNTAISDIQILFSKNGNYIADYTINEGLYIFGVCAGSVSYTPTIGTAQTTPVLLPQGLTTGRDITGVNLFENVRKQGALNLDGNSWAEVHDNASLDITDAITLEAWVKPSDTGANKMIISKWSPFANGQRSYLFYQSLSETLYFSISTDGVGSNTIVSPSAHKDDWFHFVGTYDGATQKLYVNGSQVASQAQTGSIFNGTFQLEIGRHHGDNSAINPSPIAQPRIYNRALTAEEVERNYNAGKNIYK